MSKEFKKYVKELSKKVANIDVGKLHKIDRECFKKGNSLQENLYNLEQNFVADWDSFENYEKWLEQNCGDKKR